MHFPPCTMQFRSRERNDHTVNIGSRERKCGRFVTGTKLPSNIRFHELSSPTAVALLGRRLTRYSIHHYELFNYDYRVRLKWQVNNTFKTIRKSAEIINIEDAYDQRISFLIHYIVTLFWHSVIRSNARKLLGSFVPGTKRPRVRSREFRSREWMFTVWSFRS